MANLAAVFHWQPSELKALTLDELSEFHQLAKERSTTSPKRGRQR
ncbi:GpE family phage tail protein [Sedimenticola hydrogenitrophicus]|nr:GpE family phage tail protein [Sedimenticola hydrogenitrophicus]